MIRKATAQDIQAVADIYSAIHDREEKGLATTGWLRDVYPVRQTALDALERSDLFVAEEDGRVVASAIINQIQPKEYAEEGWENDAPDEKVMVLHTLVVDPAESGHGWGSKFVSFYEEYAASRGCHYLRMDTNERNIRARRLYAGLGYREAGGVPCDFNGIPGVILLRLEKKLPEGK